MVLTALISMSAVAGAENKGGTFSISPYIGGYLFDGKQQLEMKPMPGVRLGYSFTDRIGAEASYGYARTDGTRNEAINGVKVHNYNLDLLYHFLPESRLVPFLAAGIGGVHTDINAHHAAFNYGGGVKYAINEDIDLRGDVRHILYTANETLNNLEYSVGVSFLFGRAKPAPAPVVAPAPKPEPVAAPAPPPPAPKAVAAPVSAPMDSDNDGVIDDLDKCPGTPAGVKVDAKGCPIDSDNDGVPDYLDKCPGTPAGVKVDANGCPIDSDRDGVPDYLDKCPGTPFGTHVDKDGCPPPAKKVTISLDVEFDFDKADIKKKYHEELGKVANFLEKYPTISGTIEGHTDNVGGAEYNMKLSQRRAENVKKYLVEKYKVSATRLTAKGYGLTKPIADNNSAKGRQKNRRVQGVFEATVTQ